MTKKNTNPQITKASVKEANSALNALVNPVTTQTQSDLIRTKKNGCYQLKESNYLGKYYAQVEDPLANTDDESVKDFILSDDFAKIQPELIACIYKLFAHLAQKEYGTEVQVLLIRSYEDPFLWRALVPKQVVGPASVKADCTTYADIQTGALVEKGVFPPPGWFHAGSSHSHVNMSAFFSLTDDESELKTPGVHFVWGKLKEKQIQMIASVVYRRTRYIVPINSIAHLNLNHTATFHVNVLPLITNQPLSTKGFSAAQLPNKFGLWTNKTELDGLPSTKRSKGRPDHKDYDLVNDDPFFFDPNFGGYAEFSTEEPRDTITEDLITTLEEALIDIHWMESPMLLEKAKKIISEYL